MFVANAALCLLSAVAGLVAPGEMFRPFGVDLDTGGQLIARGYASTLLGFGAIFFLLRGTTDGQTVRALLMGSLLFNVAEVIVQGTAAAAGTVSPMIWGTVVIPPALRGERRGMESCRLTVRWAAEVRSVRAETPECRRRDPCESLTRLEIFRRRAAPTGRFRTSASAEQGASLGALSGSPENLGAVGPAPR